MKKLKLILFSVLFIYGSLSAREGMWIPLLIEKYNLAEMQEMGFELSARDIYDRYDASMKDAVVIFGGGCTGSMISGEGLLLTNHHCGYRQIQALSSVESDYLTEGFWAMSRKEELPNPGLSVRFLEYMEDVTAKVLDGAEMLMEDDLEKKIKENSEKIQRQAAENGKYLAQVRPLFYGNQYYLYVYKIYRDVRLVGAPPSSIGKFGGDTDNWMWPRHSGDFALFRVYAGADNEPADYSPDNVPFRPKAFFPVSLDGVEEGDFTMVFGNPGSTMQYIPSHELEIIKHQRNPDRIAIRDRKLEIIGDGMQTDPKVRIQYAAKHASVSNAWKRWQGEIPGLKRLDAVNQKRAFEEAFKIHLMEKGSWETEFKKVFEDFDVLYPLYGEFIRASDYYSEIVFRGIEIFQVASQINSLIQSIGNDQESRFNSQLNSLAVFLPEFFKDFNQPIDEQLFESLLFQLANDLNPEFIPDHLTRIISRHGQDKLAARLYRRSLLSDQRMLEKLIEEGDVKKLQRLRKDPLVELFKHLSFHYETQIKPAEDEIVKQLNRNMKIYMAGIMEMKKDQPLYPDANLTLRVTYGRVEGYEPHNGVKYKHYTTLKGVMEKSDQEFDDYKVPERLLDLFEAKDFGAYAKEDCVPVCFIASNHTTGGNSGSPLVNSGGHLVGINFDRCWEGIMSDMVYDPAKSRNISVDIRYVLFIVDKFAGAGYLLEEMEIVQIIL